MNGQELPKVARDMIIEGAKSGGFSVHFTEDSVRESRTYFYLEIQRKGSNDWERILRGSFLDCHRLASRILEGVEENRIELSELDVLRVREEKIWIPLLILREVPKEEKEIHCSIYATIDVGVIESGLSVEEVKRKVEEDLEKFLELPVCQDFLFTEVNVGEIVEIETGETLFGG